MHKLALVPIIVFLLSLFGCAENDRSVSDVPAKFTNYVGRPYSEVYAELEAHGVRVIATEKESIEPIGKVISQNPKPGADIETEIELIVAIGPVGLPDVLGYSYAEAKTILERFDLAVRERPVIDESEEVGVVISQEPAPGTENVALVTLMVAREPSSWGVRKLQFEKPNLLLLEDIVSVSNGFLEYGTFASNGTVYPNSTSMRFDSSEPAVIDINLARAFSSLEGVIGLSDTSPGDAEAEVVILGDGRELVTATVGSGETIPISANVADVLRLTVRFSSSDQNAEVILGDWVVRGEEGSDG